MSGNGKENQFKLFDAFYSLKYTLLNLLTCCLRSV